jgi:hypothetical protein
MLLLTMHHIVFMAGPIFWRNCRCSMRPAALGSLRRSRPQTQLTLPTAAAGFQGDRSLRTWPTGSRVVDVSPQQFRPDLPVQTFQWRPLMFSAALLQALKALSQQYGATLFMTLLAAFHLCCTATPARTISWWGRSSPCTASKPKG